MGRLETDGMDTSDSRRSLAMGSSWSASLHLLVIEDDPKLTVLLRKGLVIDGHVVDTVRCGADGLERAQSDAYDAVILDLTLPDLDGLEVARRLRDDGSSVPILMLTARDALRDRVHGLAAGADDYLCKPFAFEELRLRLRAITRRGPILEPDRLVVADLILDRATHEVTRAGRPLVLPPKQYALLEYLMRHPSQVRSREAILDRVWDYGFDPFANVVESAIRRLREAVDNGHERKLVHTVRGVGYTIRAE
jgi:two-component system, OmpR family, copper resistance phosphate regulon response regulator CusR